MSKKIQTSQFQKTFWKNPQSYKTSTNKPYKKKSIHTNVFIVCSLSPSQTPAWEPNNRASTFLNATTCFNWNKNRRLFAVFSPSGSWCPSEDVKMRNVLLRGGGLRCHSWGSMRFFGHWGSFFKGWLGVSGRRLEKGSIWIWVVRLGICILSGLTLWGMSDIFFSWKFVFTAIGEIVGRISVISKNFLYLPNLHFEAKFRL